MSNFKDRVTARFELKISSLLDETAGISQSQMVKFERQAATFGGIKPEGRDKYVALCIIYGPRGHPKIIIRRTYGFFLK